MWKYGSRIIKEGRPWIDDDGVKHPRMWRRWTDEEIKERGLVWHEPVIQEPKKEDGD
tara:strand:- start:40 stop:210 length:171 start_codon:yes stop_codon:yes gene_type:complete